MMNKFSAFVVGHPIWVILIVLTIVIPILAGSDKLIFRGDYRVFFGQDNPQLQEYESMQKIYSKNDNVSFIVVPAEGDIFSSKHLTALKKLTDDSWKIPYSTRVDSITNFQHSYASQDNIIIEDLVSDVHALSDSELDRIRAIALQEPLLLNKIVSGRGNVSIVNVTVRFPELNPFVEVPEVASSARALKEKFMIENPGSKVFLSGMVMMNTAFSESSMHDSAKLNPLMYLVVILVIGVLLRTIAGTIATVVVIKLSAAATMGIAGWLGFYLTSPSALAPAMILTLAVADCVHILATMYYEMRQGVEKKTAIINSLKLNFKPVAITSITTAIGFLCMNISDSPPYRDLGNLVAIGVILSFILTMTVLPALLTLLPAKVRVEEGTSKSKLMEGIAEYVINKRKLLLISISIIASGFVLSVQNNELNDDYVKYFDHTVPFRVATDFMQESISGMTVLEISVDSGTENGINDPNYLKVVSEFSDWLRLQNETDHVNTITDTVKRLNKNMHGDDPAWYRLPETNELTAQYLLLYEMSLPYGLDMNNQINVDKSATKLVATFKNITANEIMDVEDRINKWFSEYGGHNTVVIASPSLMFAHIGERGIKSLLISTTLALLLISILFGFVLKSWRYGVLSLVPNLLPITIGYGIWGIVDGQIGVALAVVSGMTLGIVVDDTVHFMSKYLHARRNNGSSPSDAVHYAFSNVGNALLITTFVLAAGFAVLAQSSFKTNADMGLLTAITIVIALIIDFLFLPPLLMAFGGQGDRNRTKVPRQESESISTFGPAEVRS